MNVRATYIHIPFCHEICHYCDFAKMYYDERLADEYLHALHKEMEFYLGDNSKLQMDTIYIGGGTPTSLNEQQLEVLMQSIDHFYDISSVKEFTIEANPGEFNEGHVRVMKQYGINRISLGVQVLDDDYLEMLNRIHTVADVEKSVDMLQSAGLTNISMDFIYALPEQSVSHFKRTLEKALAFNLPHYSSYALQIEPKTVFYLRHQQGKLHKPPEEDEVEMYHALLDMMEEAGLNHYEVSNFSKTGYESLHNLTYWDNKEYFAFGAGAHGYLNEERYVNIRPVNHYIQAIQQGEKPILHRDTITLKEKVEEEMFLGLRRQQGVSDQNFQQKYGFSFYDLYKNQISQLIEKGFLEESNRSVRMTRQGKLFGNEVFASFLIDEKMWKKVFTN
ncbi:coproporphyrinogen III oxidase [Halalkalibacillus sediminis]|uniref:Heme chaperone HemW n=1 Tax=Halalkalibacillus sediminis TaxID=2018042 RepID=A0A2I0QXJ5_9BACI|nr:radical SAM family heme chaperone HemW [Halalkalibacillus sediminis]PKR79044.1 coproporphyrinogen III oxidase [Halalkalibacillus sediminis]